MPVSTKSALAVSLIPATVILVYNVIEGGVPGGGAIQNIQNFLGSDTKLSEGSSSISFKNISVLLNGSTLSFMKFDGNSIDIGTSPKPETEATTEEKSSSTTSRSPRTVTSATTTRVTSTSTSTSTTPIPVDLPTLSVCCDKVYVTSNGQIAGSCEDNEEALVGSPLRIWTAPSHLMGTLTGTKFHLETVSPACKDGTFVGQLPLSSDVDSPDHFLPGGILKYQNEYYHPQEYCINGNWKSEGVLDVKICKINCSNPETPCVKKCCGYDEIYSMGMKGQRGGCMRMDLSKNETIWGPALYDHTGKRLSKRQLDEVGIVPHIIQSNPTSFRHSCPRNATTVFPYGQPVADFLSSVLKYRFSSLKFMMRKDGWLMNPTDRTNIAISKSQPTTKYCIDGVMNYGSSELPFMNLEDQTVVFLCVGGPEELTEDKVHAENLVASSSNMNSVSTSTTTTTPVSTTTTTTTTLPPSTTRTPSTTTTTLTTTSTTTTPTTTTTRATTTTTTTPATTRTTSTRVTTTTSATTKATTRATTARTTIPTKVPTSSKAKSNSSGKSQKETPVLYTLPVCCPLDPNAVEESDSEVTNHCKKSLNEMKQLNLGKNASSTFWTAPPNFIHTHKATKFRLDVMPLGCEKWKKEFVYDLGKLLSPVEPVLMPNGMLKIGNDYYRSGEYCVNGIFRKTVEVYVCKTNCSDSSTPCIQKCCAPNEVYSLGEGGKKRGCIPLGPEDTPFNPPLYKNIQTKLSETELQSVTPHLLQQYPPKFQYKCYKNVTLVFPYSSDVVQLMSPLAQINLEFRLRQDGRIIYKHPSIRDSTGELIESAFSTFNYCIDGIRHWGEPEGPYKNPEDQTILFVCAVNPPAASSTTASTLLPS